MDTWIAIGLSSAAAGSLDLASAAFLARRRGMSVAALLQFVASGALGEAAFRGGMGSATAGVLFHYLIAVLWAAAYFLLRARVPGTVLRPLVFGALYGVGVHLAMSLVVVPLSRTPKRLFAWRPWLIQLAIHMAFVGVPIALVQSWCLRTLG